MIELPDNPPVKTALLTTFKFPSDKVKLAALG